MSNLPISFTLSVVVVIKMSSEKWGGINLLASTLPTINSISRLPINVWAHATLTCILILCKWV